MVSKWSKTTLAEVSSDVAYGYTESATAQPVGPHFLRITDIQNGVVDWRQVPFCPISAADHSKYRLQQGDIVVARTGNSTGENYLYQGDSDAVFASYLIRFRVDTTTTDATFVWYQMRSASWWNFINGAKTGSAQAGANAKVLGTFPLMLPPLPDQKRIAHVFSTLDDKIELNRKMNATLEAMSRAIFKSWFMDFDPVRQKAAGKQPVGMDAETAALFPDSFEDSELGEVPTGWEVISLSELIDIKGGTQPPKSKWSDEPKPGYVRMIQIRDYYTDSHIAYVPDTPNLRRATKEDVMIARYGASVGRICWGLEGAYNVALVRCEMQKPNTQEFVRSYLLSTEFQNRLEMMSNRSAQAGFNKGDIASFKLVFPTKPSILQAYENFSKTHLVQVRENKKQSRTLAALRDTLLPKLLSGEIRVPEAEEAVEEAVA